jgi:xanthine/uracil permease
MATQTSDLPGHLFEQGALWAVGFVALWIFWAIFFIYEYVSDSIRLSAFLVALVVGTFIGIGFGYWHRQTETGLRANRLYRDAPTGQKVAVVLLAAISIVAVIYLATTVGVSVLLVEAGSFAAALAIHLFDVGLVHSHTG